MDPAYQTNWRKGKDVNVDHNPLWMRNTIKAILLWLLLLPAQATITIVQRWVLINVMGFVPGTIVAGLILILVIFLLAYLGWARGKPQSASVYWVVGALWAVLWVALQVYNVLVRHAFEWQDLVQYYTFWAGSLGLLVLLALAIAPRIAGMSAMRGAREVPK